MSKHKDSKYFCDRCLAYFHSEEKLKVHEVECETLFKCKIRLRSPKPDNTENSYKILKFKNFKNKEKVQFVVYADFESVLLKIDNDDRKVHQHEPSAVSYFVMCPYDESKSYYRSHVGADSAHWLMMELKELADGIDAIMKKPKAMDPLTAEEERDFMDATCCHICEKPFQDGEERIKDHSHLTGKYRGPAHNSCNLNYPDLHVIPIIFHNLSGYDGHYLINDMANCLKGRIDLIPLNKEKYISFTNYIKQYYRTQVYRLSPIHEFFSR